MVRWRRGLRRILKGCVPDTQAGHPALVLTHITHGVIVWGFYFCIFCTSHESSPVLFQYVLPDQVMVTFGEAPCHCRVPTSHHFPRFYFGGSLPLSLPRLSMITCLHPSTLGFLESPCLAPCLSYILRSHMGASSVFDDHFGMSSSAFMQQAVSGQSKKDHQRSPSPWK